MGLHQGVCPIPPPSPPGDAARVFVPSPPPSGGASGVFVTSFPVTPTPVVPSHAPPPGDGGICVAAPPPPPQPWHSPCYQSLVVGGISPPHPLPTTTN